MWRPCALHAPPAARSSPPRPERVLTCCAAASHCAARAAPGQCSVWLQRPCLGLKGTSSLHGELGQAASMAAQLLVP